MGFLKNAQAEECYVEIGTIKNISAFKLGSKISQIGYNITIKFQFILITTEKEYKVSFSLQ